MFTIEQLYNAYLARKDDDTWASLGEQFGLTKEAFRKRVKRYEKRMETGGKPAEESKERLEITEDANAITVDSRSKFIRTLSQLIEACEIDTEVWQCESPTFNAWPVSAWNKQGGYFESIQHYQVRARFIRKNPIPVFPVITPVSIDIPAHKPLDVQCLDTSGAILVMADWHAGFRRNFATGELEPFHDRKALSIALQIAKELQPAVVVILGDLLDNAEWNDKFLKEPEFYQTTQPAIEEAAWWLAQFRLACSNSRIVILEGNHDARIERYLITHLSAAYQLRAVDATSLPALSLPNLLGLDRLGIEYVAGYPDASLWIDDIKFTHGNLASSVPGEVAKKVAQRAHSSTCYGHNHIIEQVTRVVVEQETRHITAACLGCMCRVDGIVPGHRPAEQNWANGLGIVTPGAVEQFESVRIVGGVGVWRGGRYVVGKHAMASFIG